LCNEGSITARRNCLTIGIEVRLAAFNTNTAGDNRAAKPLAEAVQRLVARLAQLARDEHGVSPLNI
jgi:hypothetical protein